MSNATANERDDFFAGLMQDHARIEARLKELEHAALTLSSVNSDAETLAVIAGTLRFFATEGACHEAHEELTLFPRLRALSEFNQIISALRFQHQMNEAEGNGLATCLDRGAPGSGRELRRLALRFVELHRGHAIAEERALFPLAASMLSPQVLAEMGGEMRERRSAAGPVEER